MLHNMPTAEIYVLVGDQNSLIQIASFLLKKENNNYLHSLDNWKSEKKYQQNALLNVYSVCLSQLIYLFNMHIDTHNLSEKRWKKNSSNSSTELWFYSKSATNNSFHHRPFTFFLFRCIWTMNCKYQTVASCLFGIHDKYYGDEYILILFWVFFRVSLVFQS